jgi:hypothetical protein
MSLQQRYRGAIIAGLAAFATTVALAQPQEGRRGPPPPPTAQQIQTATGVDAGKAQQVAAVLEAAAKQREETRAKLEALLTPEQMRKLREAMGPPGGGPGGQGGPKGQH